MRVGRAEQASLLSALDSAKYVHYEGPATLSSPSSIASFLLPLSPLLQSYMNPLTELAWAPSGILVWPNHTGMDGMYNYVVHGVALS